MEFEFIKNSFTGEYLVRCEMGQEVIARLLQEEISTSDRTIMEITALLTQAAQFSGNEFKWQGKEISLSVVDSEVHVYENSLAFDSLMEMDEEFSVYESESYSECGLEDFRSVLAQWERFIHNRW